MGRILHFIENCILIVILSFGIFPITAATALFLSVVFHIKLAYTIFISFATLCALCWILYFCLREEPFVVWSWLWSQFGRHSLTRARNLFWSFCMASIRKLESIRFFKEALVLRLKGVRRNVFVPTLIALASVLALSASLWYGIEVYKAVLSESRGKAKTEKKVDANKNTPKKKARVSYPNKSKSKPGKQPARKK